MFILMYHRLKAVETGLKICSLVEEKIFGEGFKRTKEFHQSSHTSSINRPVHMESLELEVSTAS
jgi:hypothetical protein